MRDFKGMKRQRGRNRKPGGGANANSANPNRSWDSQGPENIKVRGNAQTVYERYLQLGRDAGASGDRVLAENYLQHAEHYFRVLRALQPARPVSEIAARELSNQGFDIDFEDESGAQAAAFLAAQKAADQAAERSQNGGHQNGEPRDEQPREGGQREWRDRDQGRDRDRDSGGREGQPREGQPRDGQARDAQDREPRADGEDGQSFRRETRRERWERRREERNRRFEAEGGIGEAPSNERFEDSAEETATSAVTEDQTGVEVASPEKSPSRAERPRRTRMPRENDHEDGPSALPGFLTRAPASASEPAPEPASESQDAQAPEPKRRAPRRKPQAAPAED